MILATPQVFGIHAAPSRATENDLGGCGADAGAAATFILDLAFSFFEYV
jgi:hypothetical protein